MNGVGFSSAPQVKCPITKKITKMAIFSETSLTVYFSVSLCLVVEKPILKWSFFVVVYLSKMEIKFCLTFSNSTL